MITSICLQMRIFLFVLLAVVGGYPLIGQSTFQKTIGGDGRDVGYSIVATTDGHMVISGVSTSFENSKEVYVIKMDTLGNKLWSRVYGSSGVEIAVKMEATPDGGVVILGDASGKGIGVKDILIIKLDQDGNLDWARSYGGKLNDYGLDIHATTDGGYIAVGETNSFDAWDHDILLMKLKGNGDVEWGRIIGADTVDYANSVIEVEDGYVMGGETNSFGDNEDILLVKVNKKGELQWSKAIGDTLDDNQDDLIRDTDSTFVLVGSTESYGFKQREILFLRVGLTGHVQLAKTYGGDLAEEPKTIKRLEDGYVIGGFSNSWNETVTEEDAYLIRTNLDGSLRYSKTFGGQHNDFMWSLDVFKEGFFVMTGITNSFSNREEDHFLYVLKTQDKRKILNCEMTNVQTISLKLKPEQMHEHEVGLKVKPVEITQTDYSNIEMREIDDQILDVCTDGLFYKDIEGNDDDSGIIEFD